MSSDVLWILICAALVMIMQGGFLCLESGATRSKNAINVAMKNAADFVMAVFVFWLFGFGLMFGATSQGLVGSTLFAVDLSSDAYLSAVFLFQSMFCATAATIVSGAIAERTRFNGYLLIGFWVIAFVYPIAGHWSWAGILSSDKGWLEERGFIDFAGSTVVHSVGGWVALAAVIIVGPRIGRFNQDKVEHIPGSNIPLVLLGVILFQVGWIGFNGGSTLELNEHVPGIIVNTVIAGVSGGVVAYTFCNVFSSCCFDRTLMPLNGVLAGMVSVTANAHLISSPEAVVIAAIGALFMLFADKLMVSLHLDDAIGAVPVHLAAGIWGTVAVALFGDVTQFQEGLTRFAQLKVQLLGVVIYGLWAFGLTYFVLSIINRIKPLRVTAEQEKMGLNVSEHEARTELVDLLEVLEEQEGSGDLSARAPVEPFTEVGQIALAYNRVMTSLEGAVEQTRNIVRDIRDGVFTFGADGRLTSFNPGAERLFALTASEAMGKPLIDLIAPSDQYKITQSKEGTGEVGYVIDLDKKQELKAQRADRSEFAIELTVTESESSNSRQFTGLIRDITERKQFEDQLYQEKELALVTLASIADGVITTDDQGNIKYLNPTAEKLTGWKREEAIGRPLREVYRLMKEGSIGNVIDVAYQILTQHKPVVGLAPHQLLSRYQRNYSVEHTAAPINDRQGQIVGVVVVFHDVTQTREMQKQLSHQATHDSLTGLMNRGAFESRLVETIKNSRIEKNTHVLCYLDLDQFKLVNDTCGHIAGDELLRQLSQILQAKMRAGDVLARLGGDEFGLLLYGCPLEQGENIANEFRKVIYNFRFPWNEKLFAIGVSIGLVPISEETENLSSLLSLADAACYAAKDKGRNCVHVYEPDDLEVAQKQGQMQWVAKIRDALDRDRLRLYFQQIEATNKTKKDAKHFEIFVRMLGDDDEIIPPGAFIPAAERFGLMWELDSWIIQNTLAWLGDHLRRFPDQEFLCALNISGQSISNTNCLEEIKYYLEQYKVPGKQVSFEITETAAIANLKSATQFIHELKQLGCTFALDDFGSGLSSFGYLKNLPVDYIKIDGAFVREIDKNTIDKTMVESITSIAHVMGLKTIAEFVENEASLSILNDIGVDRVQGYHIGRPRPLEQMDGVFFMPR